VTCDSMRYGILTFCGSCDEFALETILNLDTDGGRIASAFFGRTFARLLEGFVLFVLVVVGFFGLDQSSLLLTYALFTSFYQRDPEIPCLNEVDDLGVTRGIIAILTSMVVAISLIPMTGSS
jgi:hypothetical protein